ncbi:neuroligin-4, X-linked [Cimex lectularius]|uniref:Carboxylesterase type B domain-containing protein n=1 Tax=Cimex lectularius TaxID=79782 RepID=A0A8I6TFJ9_CIMLE|nr:neuroligin-4, X-linked [Cimex lectularius]
MMFVYAALLTIFATADCQVGRQFYDKDGNYIPPSDADVDYRTYVYGQRRYGQSPSYVPGRRPYNPYGPPDPYGPDNRYNPPNIYSPNYNPTLEFQPGIPRPSDPRFDQAGIELPGVLGGWRPDLQGKQRADSPRQDTERDVVVTTSYGQVQGFRVFIYDNPNPGFRPWDGQIERVQAKVSSFLGIPYAIPPVKEGRFKPPRPHPGWQQMLHAVDFGPACPQPNKYTGATKGVRDVHEDCLYLNIYTPNIDNGVSQPYPVMMYIHGGDFIHGASNLFPGHIMAGFYNVVVVTFNYRLGALGFLSTGDHNSPGNYGILDMAMAIRWVHENINFFNGDKNSITLFGPDAGAASAGLLMVNPRTRHMVNRVIAQSGSALAEWALIQDKYKAQNTSRVFGQHLGCSIDSSYKLVDCLRRHRNFHELGNANEFLPQVGLFPWAPVLDLNFTVPGSSWYEGWKQDDWVFTNFTPEAQIKRGEFNKDFAYMTGVTTQEAATLIYNNETLSPYFDIDEEWFDKKVEEMVFRYNYTINREGIFRAIKYRYTYWPDPKNHTHIREQYIDLMSDFIYRAPTDKMIKLLVEKKVPVYFYVMNTTIESLQLPYWRKAPHNIEHLLLTGAPFMDTEFFPEKLRLDKHKWTDNDRNISHFFMKAYTDFARLGNPSPQQILGIRFEMAYHGRLYYLNFNTTFNSTIELNYRQTESAFWTWYLPTVIGILIPTYPPFTEYWWEPKQPLQIAFWTMSGTCLLLIVIVVIFCLLWRSAIRQNDRYYGADLLMMDMQNGLPEGIENPRNEYRDLPLKAKLHERKGASTPASLRSSDGSLSARDSVVTSPNGRPKTPPGKRSLSRKSMMGSTGSVPMTQV